MAKKHKSQKAQQSVSEPKIAPIDNKKVSEPKCSTNPIPITQNKKSTKSKRRSIRLPGISLASAGLFRTLTMKKDTIFIGLQVIGLQMGEFLSRLIRKMYSSISSPTVFYELKRHMVGIAIMVIGMVFVYWMATI